MAGIVPGVRVDDPRGLLALLERERAERLALEARLAALEVQLALGRGAPERVGEVKGGGAGALPGRSGTHRKLRDVEGADDETSDEESAPTGAEMDLHQVFEIEGSVWDACIFIGTRSLGFSRSIALVAMTALTALIQMYFCHCVRKYMLEDPVSEENLNSLLHFRTSTAHDVRYADQTKHTSLIASICSGEMQLRIPFAGPQVNIYDDLSSAEKAGARRLCLFALLCWFATVVGEMDRLCQFAKCLRHVTGERTILATSPEGDQVTVAALSRRRSAMLALLVLLPRAIIAGALLIIGGNYLARTTSMEDMLLNAMALAFIMDIDELFFRVFAPHRVQNLVVHLDPIASPRFAGGCWLTSGPVVKVAVVIVLMILATMRLEGLRAKLQQATDILCSGEVDFVFAQNPVTNLVEVAKSRPVQEAAPLSAAQLAVLQMAKPTLRSRPGTMMDPRYVAVSRSHVRTCQVQIGIEDLKQHLDEFRDTGSVKRFTMADFDEDPAQFQRLSSLSSATVRSAAGMQSCQDASPEEPWAAALLGEWGLESCADGLKLCRKANATPVRGLCPLTCGCADVRRPEAGFFAAPAFGCPEACQMSLRAAELLEITLQGPSPCTDISTPEFSTDAFVQSYIAGAVAYFIGSVSRLKALHHVTKIRPAAQGIVGNRSRDVFAHVASGNFTKEATQGVWRFAPGLPHPRGLEGCAFWTSWEVAVLFGVDMCGVGKFRSMRYICPETCGCRSGGQQKECPIACR